MAAVPASETKSSLPAKDILPFDARQSEAIRLFPLSNYTFGTKETQPEEDPSVKDRLRRLEEYYDNHGMRRTGEGILVCHEHNHPHILMLQIAKAFHPGADPAGRRPARRRARLALTFREQTRAAKPLTLD